MTMPPPERAGDRPTRRANRLARSTSPYLLQHAHNPVDWFAWGDEAFAEARRRDVPIFLSIGYSTCYWCHVMERESFENDSIAALMNERFVCVKVDREERPDVDDIYMTATQIMTGHGGWPMNVFLEPKTLKPFWCGTYFPPVARPDIGVPAFPRVLTNISDAFKNKRPEVIEQAEQISGLVKERLKPTSEPAAIDGIGAVTNAVSALLRSLDRNHGGFGGAPKFPQPVFLEFLLDARASAGSPETREAIDVALRLTLDRMMIGGMHDQIGGGFHRYSVDATWTVPHFEKMLYDNALLAGIYARAGTEFADAEYARTARTTCEYVLREMLLPGGGFASAQDAEVDGREGLNYLWRADEVRSILSADDANFAIRVFSMEAGPNFRDPHHPAEAARSVLRLSDRPEKVASELGMSIGAFHAQRERVAGALLAFREKHKQPGRDDKVLASWNGLMIGALARVGRAQRNEQFVAASRAAADFVLEHMRAPDGGLLRSVREAARGGPGFLEDYAFVIEGLLALADALAGKPDADQYTSQARGLAQSAAAKFADASGVFFDAPAETTELFIRARSTHDGAIPCANSVLLHGLLDLLARDQDPPMLRHAEMLLRSLAEPIAEMPLGIANATRAVLRVLTDPRISRTDMANVLRGSARPQPEQPDSFTPVEIYASEERLRISPDLPGSVRLVMKIAPGYHVIAAEPWIDDPGSAARGLIPMRVHFVGGGGLRVYADYPPGVPMPEAPEGIGRPRVYEGEIEFEIAVEADGEMTGRPLLAITFQACSATECLHPRAVELDIAIDPA